MAQRIKQKTETQEIVSIIENKYRSETVIWGGFFAIVAALIVGSVAYVLHQSAISRLEVKHEAEIEKLESKIEKLELEQELKDTKEEILMDTDF